MKGLHRQWLSLGSARQSCCYGGLEWSASEADGLHGGSGDGDRRGMGLAELLWAGLIMKGTGAAWPGLGFSANGGVCFRFSSFLLCPSSLFFPSAAANSFLSSFSVSPAVWSVEVEELGLNCRWGWAGQ